MAVVKRSELGRLLTPTEADNNFNYLYSDPPTVIISSGIITVNGGGWYLVDTEGGAGSDDLTRINGCKRGELITISSVADARVITVIHGTMLKLQGNANATLNSTFRLMNFRCFGSDVLVEANYR